MLPAQRKSSGAQNPSLNRELITREPDPGKKLIYFIGWLKKRGAVRTLSQCHIKCERMGIVIEEEIKRIGTEIICIYRTSGGEKAVVLEDKVWADQWLTYYGAEVPHHSQKTKRIFSETEKKV